MTVGFNTLSGLTVSKLNNANSKVSHVQNSQMKFANKQLEVDVFQKNCQPIKFGAENKMDKDKAKNKSTVFAAQNLNAAESKMPLTQKYELAKEIIAAQKEMICSLQKQVQTGLPKTNILNKYV